MLMLGGEAQSEVAIWLASLVLGVQERLILTQPNPAHVSVGCLLCQANFSKGSLLNHSEIS